MQFWDFFFVSIVYIQEFETILRSEYSLMFFLNLVYQSEFITQQNTLTIFQTNYKTFEFKHCHFGAHK